MTKVAVVVNGAGAGILAFPSHLFSSITKAGDGIKGQENHKSELAPFATATAIWGPGPHEDGLHFQTDLANSLPGNPKGAPKQQCSKTPSRQRTDDTRQV